jgi:acyl carrier protein
MVIPLDVEARAVEGDSWRAFLHALGRLHCAGFELRGPALGRLFVGSATFGTAELEGSDRVDERLQFLTEFVKANRAIAERALEANLRAFSQVFGGAQPTSALSDTSLDGLRALIETPVERRLPPAAGAASSTSPPLAAPASPKASSAVPAAASRPATVKRSARSVDVSAEVRQRVARIIKRHTGFSDAHLEDDVELSGSLGVDSVQQMLILDEVQKDFGIDLVKPLSEGRVPRTFGELLQLVDELR